MSMSGPLTSIDAQTATAIVCFAGNDWWVHNQMPEKHWMRSFGADRRRVLYVNSIGVGMPALSSAGLARRIGAKLTSLARWLRRGAPGVWVLTPFVLPLWSVPAVRIINTFLLALQIRPLLVLLGMRRPLLWAGLPTAAAILDAIPHRGVVYYVQDHFTAYYDTMTFSRTAADHERMLAAADAVIAAGAALGGELAARHARVVVIPHGVGDAFFTAAAGSSGTPVMPPALAGVTHPLIMYWGSLEGLQDADLIEMLACAHPDWSFVYIGRPRLNIARFASLANVRFPGYVEPDDIPAWGIHADACVMTFVQSEWIRYSCPVKLREYLALGKPVVAPDILEIDACVPALARTTRSHGEFLRALEEEVAGDDSARRSARRAAVAGWTWHRTASEVARVIDDAVSHPHAAGKEGN